MGSTNQYYVQLTYNIELRDQLQQLNAEKIAVEEELKKKTTKH